MAESKFLTHRELEVLDLIANEFTMDEIAVELYISYHTVLSHRKKLLSKLRVRNTAGMIRRAFELEYLKVNNLIALETA